MTNPKVFLGINLKMDPSVALVSDGNVLAFSEEERHLRLKHAEGIYPSRALRYCLDVAGVRLEDVEAVGINWNLEAYNDGTMRAFYDSMDTSYPVDNATRIWQNRSISSRDPDGYRESHEIEWRRMYGDVKFPKIYGMPHHYVHAFQAYMQSPFNESICLTIDGSGDQNCTVLWKCSEGQITPIKSFEMPHSLGWFYAAFTEYLGFDAYDGEYKVMGLAAYGESDSELKSKVSMVVSSTDDEVGYRLDPSYIHYGNHAYSGRFTDKLVELFARAPRRMDEEIDQWHKNLAFAVQETLEDAATRLVCWAVRETGIRNLCISGGVGLNVKMNSKLFQLPEIDDVFAHPLCSDSGAAAGAALAACYDLTGAKPERLTSLALGYEETPEQIERTLKLCRVDYEKPPDICGAAADELAKGRIVGWFQGRMESGPRALGQRSILADPRSVESRDKVNAIIKFREDWRPFCPSIIAESMPDYFVKYTEAPFMIISFEATDKLTEDAPAIVHVDGTSRVQMVHKEASPRFYKLLKTFQERTGVPVVLNTSFNVQGEPIVCTVKDALRTFWATGLEVLVLEDFLLRKPVLDAQQA